MLDTYEYENWYEEESNDSTRKNKQGIDDLPPMPLEGEKLKTLTPKKLLTRLPLLLAGNSSNKLKNEIRQILYLLYHQNKITKKVYNK